MTLVGGPIPPPSLDAACLGRRVSPVGTRIVAGYLLPTPHGHAKHGENVMLEDELAYRVTVGTLGIAGFALRLYYQRQFRDVQRTAGRGIGRDKALYWCVFGSFLLAFIY